MKVITNKVFRNVWERRAVMRGGALNGFTECVICGKSMTNTYFVCEDCTRKWFRDGEYDMNRFIDYVRHYTKLVKRGDNYYGIIPAWANDPAAWMRERRRGTI